MKILKTLMLAGLTNSIAMPVIADTTLIYNDKQGNVAMKMQFADNKMRATSVADNSTYMTYDANTVTFTTFMTDEKQYFVMDKATIEKLADVGAMIQEIMDKQLADMPADQRDMMRGMIENMVKSQMPKEQPKAEYILTGKSSAYNGFACEIVVKKVGKTESEFCVAEYSDLGMSASEFSIITSFQKTLEVLAQKYGQDHSMDFSSLGEYMPVQYEQVGDTGVLSAVNNDKLDPSLFTIPEGYSQMDLPF